MIRRWINRLAERLEEPLYLALDTDDLEELVDPSTGHLSLLGQPGRTPAFLDESSQYLVAKLRSRFE